ncbi:polyketide cyclase [Saccharothrix sp. BKS2]|uniref:SRPBCC family protein n=1 Tax=Saccharothrix sp. BKS2 TaxID=3064400 RepID=UPI0039ED15BE
MVDMSLNSYRFRSAWWLDSTPGQVFDVLADLGGYPHWWREVREARQVAQRAAELRCRSLLPYDLVFEARHHTEDRDAGLLRADLAGDLDGTASWRVLPDGPGARLVFEQEVVVRKALLRALAPVARPVFRFNHALMMRSAERGLRTYLAGFLAGRRERVTDQVG